MADLQGVLTLVSGGCANVAVPCQTRVLNMSAHSLQTPFIPIVLRLLQGRAHEGVRFTLPQNINLAHPVEFECLFMPNVV